MRRKRFLKGSVRPRQHGRRKVWVAQWWEDGCRRSKVLGKCSEISKSQADAMMASILQPLNQDSGQLTPPRYAFSEYVEDVFLPVHRRKWKESTRATSEHTIRRHLLPTLGDRRLSEIGREELQLLLDSKARTHSASVVAHPRWHLSAIFRMALSDGAISVNPSPGLFTPACQPEKPRLVMSVSEIQRALDVLPLRERLMFRMAVFAGMRPGEILALRVGNVEDSVVHIEQRVYQGKLDSPKGRKGKRTARTIALPPGTAVDLLSWREQFAELAPEAFLFPSERGTPLTRENVWRRNMLPHLQPVGLEWASFQVMRRTNASLSRKANIDDKVAADQRGHGLGVSLEVYSVSDLQQKIEAVTRLESTVLDAPQSTANSEPPQKTE